MNDKTFPEGAITTPTELSDAVICNNPDIEEQCLSQSFKTDYNTITTARTLGIHFFLITRLRNPPSAKWKDLRLQYIELFKTLKNEPGTPQAYLAYHALKNAMPIELCRAFINKKEGFEPLVTFDSMLQDILRARTTVMEDLIKSRDRGVHSARNLSLRFSVDSVNEARQKTEQAIIKFKKILPGPLRSQAMRELEVEIKFDLGNSYNKCLEVLGCAMCNKCQARRVPPKDWLDTNTECVFCFIVCKQTCPDCRVQFERYEYCPCWLYALCVQNREKNNTNKNAKRQPLVPEKVLTRLNTALWTRVEEVYSFAQYLSIKSPGEKLTHREEQRRTAAAVLALWAIMSRYNRATKTIETAPSILNQTNPNDLHQNYKFFLTMI